MILQWLLDNWLEVFAFVVGLLYVYYEIREDWVLWIFCIISAIVYTLVFLLDAHYAQAGLNVCYFIVGIYGLFNWLGALKTSAPKQPQKTLQISHIPLKPCVILLGICAILSVLAGWLLTRYTNSPTAYLDAFISVYSLLATWMVAKKYIESWFLWIATDSIAVPLYFYSELYPTAVLFAIYLPLSYIGYKEWKKNYLMLHTDPVAP
ncbi:nicotinamide mononucleotide transporter [Bacteroidia bacterium]|nr:nicotinamide mononucleotide transporter [Bacteroidia bacterium]